MKQQNIYFLEEILKQNYNQKSVWYHLARSYEKEGLEYLEIGDRTIHRFFIRKARKAYKQAYKLGYIGAQVDLARLKEEHSLSKRKSSLKIPILAFLIGISSINIPSFLANGEELPNQSWAKTYDSKEIKNVEFNEPVTVLRSSVYQYVKQHHRFPKSLDTLVSDFPNNFSSDIPKEQISQSNIVYKERNNHGGWVYTPPHHNLLTNLSEKQLIDLITKAVNPNNDTCKNSCTFYPLELIISKPKNQLFAVSGPFLLRSFPVALGKDDATPAGTFFIQKKVEKPNFHLPNTTKPFGTRGMELSDSRYAIHGTYDTSNIGKNVSLGCVRLSNYHIENLFDITPLYTEVKITNTVIQEEFFKNEESRGIPTTTPNEDEASAPSEEEGAANENPSIPPSTNSNIPPSDGDKCFCKPIEEDGSTVYHWAS